MLVAGVTVEHVNAEGRVRGAQVRVLAFGQPARNDWFAVNEFTIVENKHERRPDIVLFVNGLPLAVVELKNPADENATIRSAFQQLQTYKAEIPSLFTFNAALVVSDGLEARIGALTAGQEWFKPWRTIACCRARETERICPRVDRKMLWPPVASSDHQRARVLAVVKAPRCTRPPLRGADGLDDGSAHARSDWLLSVDAQSQTPKMLGSTICSDCVDFG